MAKLTVWYTAKIQVFFTTFFVIAEGVVRTCNALVNCELHRQAKLHETSELL